MDAPDHLGGVSVCFVLCRDFSSSARMCVAVTVWLLYPAFTTCNFRQPGTSISPNAIPIAPPPGGASPGPALYQSLTTRVVRSANEAAAGTGVVCKEYLGAQSAQRQRNERDILGRLAGIDGVVRLAAASSTDDVLTLVDSGGVSLADLLQTGKCSTDTVVSLACQMARILAEVHRAGVIHRDINPANILWTDTNHAVLIDFDMAIVAAQQTAGEAASRIVGTLGYLAPEQTGRTGRSVDQRADLYALGATLYEMAVGTPPFRQDDPLALIHDHLVREPVAPREVDASVPRGLSNIILRLLAKEPDERYQGAYGLLHDLQRLRSQMEAGPGDGFELGERDFPARLAPPSQLAGRNGELKLLLGAFNSALHTAGRTVLVNGAAGVGKSALVNQLRPVVAAAGGWFIYGKFDQYQRDTSTSGALTQAMRALGRLLLTQSADRVAVQRERILQKLGRNAGMIARASPEFGLLLGVHTDVPPADPRQAELELKQATLDVLAAVAGPESPLVVVVDDLQWASDFSLRLFERLMVDPDLRGVLLVGSYRPVEVDSRHELALMLERCQRHSPVPAQIALANLSHAGMSDMIGQMLRMTPRKSGELAMALDTLTGGNPLDTLELVNALRNDGFLRLEESGWAWDEASVRRFIGGGNVVDLLSARITRLPEASRDLLEFMSLLGSEVDFRLLRAAIGGGDARLREQLRAPLDDGLLLADGRAREENGAGGFRFRHDRVQQAILVAMDEPKRRGRQLAMARRLAGQPAFAGEAAQQYMACADMLDEPAEMRRTAQLFHGVAQALARTGTFTLVERYLASADRLLAAIDDPGDGVLRRAVDVARHCALYSLGRVDEADPLFEMLEARTPDPFDLVEPTCLQMRRLHVHGRARESLALGVRMLKQLGLGVPPGFIDPDSNKRLDAVGEWVRQEIRLDHSRQWKPHDQRMLAFHKLLARTAESAFHGNDVTAFTWLVLQAQRLWAEHGPNQFLIGCLSNLGCVLVELRNDYRTAYECARHIVAVGERLGLEMQTASARCLFAWRVCSWFEPLENSLVHATRAAQYFVNGGDDASHACYASIPRYEILLELAPRIDICQAELEMAQTICRRTGNVHAAALHTLEQQCLRALRGQTQAPESFDDENFNEEEFFTKLGGHPSIKHSLQYHHGLHSLVWGEAAGLIQNATASLFHGVESDMYRATHGWLVLALARARQLQQGDCPASVAAPLRADLESCRAWFAGRAADQSYNFLHLLRLVEAEQAWALGDMWKAATTFDAAVLEAGTRQRPWHRALITERAGLFNLSRGLEGAGRNLLARACDHYDAWGAAAKVDQMQRKHAFLRAPARSLASQVESSMAHTLRGSSSLSSELLDLVGVLQASQALSSETSQERLTSRVTEVLASLSGATKVLVLSFSEGQWWLLPHAQAPAPMTVAQAAEHGLLPLSAFAYAERTQQVLIVDDVAMDDRFSRDPYFAAVPLCSLLLVPIAGHGAARGMLMLENRLGRAAFNAQRLDAVMLIAGQLAVSLANAQLYESLERRVQARTRELKETQEQLVTTARRAGMAEVANNVLHNVGNVLNSINVSARVMRENIGKSRIDGLSRAVALINEHEHDLPRFLESDPRGKALWPYLNQLVGALHSEREAIMGDLDRLSLSVDHVTYVVATQQSHAGNSSVVEMVRGDELVEEALHLSADAIHRCGIALVRRYEEVAASALDRQRLVQILVNLIGNAAQAMEGTPVQTRFLTLGIRLVQGEAGNRVHFTVQDAGEGIAQENLPRIFAHGFTTRRSGHGFGLHSSALAATEMGGRLIMHSDGPGLGAVFTIDMPHQQSGWSTPPQELP